MMNFWNFLVLSPTNKQKQGLHKNVLKTLSWNKYNFPWKKKHKKTYLFQSKKEQRIYENYKFTCLQSIVKYIVAFLNQWLLGGDGCCCFYCYLCVLLRNQTHNVQMDNIAPGGAVQCSVLPFYGNPTEANIFAYICSKRKTYTSLMI